MMHLVAIIAATLLGAGAAAAQVPAVDHAVSGATDIFLDKGVLGAVALIGLLATGLLAWRFNALWIARLEDARTANRELIETNKTTAEALRVSADKLGQLAATVDASTRGADERWRTLGELLAALTPIQNGIASNASALGRIEADTRTLCNRGSGQ